LKGKTEMQGRNKFMILEDDDGQHRSAKKNPAYKLPETEKDMDEVQPGEDFQAPASDEDRIH
jgi:hypothetical protein